MKISVVVPVFNSENYIKRCIDSITAQTYPEWELILVDDGSTDSSMSILEEYEKADKRIKAIHQENCGPGIARNTGISLATGDYLVFVDSDDIITNDYFYRLSKETSDVVFIDIDQVDENLSLLCEEHMSKYNSLAKDQFIRYQMTGRIPWGGVRKCVKLNLIRKYGILFSEHKIGEEAIYSFMVLYFAQSFSFIEGTVYRYINRQGSQSDSIDDDPWGPVAKSLSDRIHELGIYEKYANTLNAFMTTAAVVSLSRMANHYLLKDYKNKAKKRILSYQNAIDHNYVIALDDADQRVKYIYPFLKKGWIWPIWIANTINRLHKRK